LRRPGQPLSGGLLIADERLRRIVAKET